VLQVWERKKDVFGRVPVERSHGEIIVFPFSDSQLLFKIGKAIEFATSVEFLIVFSVAALDFAVVPWRVRPDQLVPDPKLLQSLLKQCLFRVPAVCHTIRKFKSIICLYTLDRIRELFNDIFEKQRGGIGAVFRVCLEDTEPAVLVNECVLEITLAFRFSDQAGFRNIFHINLTPLPRILHLFVRFGFLFGVGELDGFAVDPAQDTIQAGDGSGIAALAQPDPEYHQTGVGIPAAHILYELELGFRMLVGMAVRTVSTVCKGVNCSVIFLTPAVDVLPGGLVADGCLGDSVFERILNYHLLKPHVLCYLTHSE